jgi:protein-S-isoprenylcysteine O-methyltransferase Ste14
MSNYQRLPPVFPATNSGTAFARCDCAAIIRNVLTVLRTIAWLACVVYATIPAFWLVIHPRAAYWRLQKRSPYRILMPLWVAMWIVVGAITARWRGAMLYTTVWTSVPALFLFAAGLWIYRRSGAGFSAAQLGGLPELVPRHREQRLVTSGIRARVRHPIYLGHLCEMLAWSLGTGLVVCYGLTAFALISGAVMIRLEDRELDQRFGEEYRDYRRKVPAVLPRISARIQP